MADPTRPAPIPLILTCPLCSERHVDTGVFAERPHHTHECQVCGFAWRPAVAHTVGVQFLPGLCDEVLAAEPVASDPAPAPAPPGNGWRYLSATVCSTDFGKNLLRLDASALETTFPSAGVEVWTQVVLTIDSRLRDLERLGLRVVVELNEREILFRERPSAFADRLTMALPVAHDIDYAKLSIRLEGAEDPPLRYGMVFRLAANVVPKE